MVTINEVEQAYERIAKHIHKTPIFSSRRINEILGCEITFKCENFQKVGAFKFRGAINAVSLLSDDERSKGVVTHSSGNHAQALSLAAKLFNIPAYIVMPENAPQVKIDAVKEYGGQITFCKPILVEREKSANALINKYKATFIHPYDNDNIIAGQGTCALEVLSQIELEPDIIMAPVGGGGLLSGTAISTKAKTIKTKVFAAEPKMADDAYRSFKANKLIPQNNPQTIADGLLTSLSDRTFEIIEKYVDDVVLCNEKSIFNAMLLIYENLKIVVEPSAAVPLACVLDNKELFSGKRIVLILSGGNVDIKTFKWQ